VSPQDRQVPAPGTPRIIYDITSVAHWNGPPTGIVRVSRAFAAWAHAHIRDAVFAFFDPRIQSFRKVVPAWVMPIVNGDAFADTWALYATGPRARGMNRFPSPIRPIAKWVIRPRRQLFAALERLRLGRRRAFVNALAERSQLALMSEKYRKELVLPDGRRRAYVPFESAFGAEIRFGPGDTLVSVGSTWADASIEAIRHLKAYSDARLVVLCHDLIPHRFPEFYSPAEVAEFRLYFDAIFPTADRIIFTTHCMEAEARLYCLENGRTMADSRVSPLGMDVLQRRSERPPPLPPGLTSQRYILFVSTIEPRKGHRLLYKIWLRLVHEGLPQATGFKLVFVGRPGWGMDDLLAELRNDARVQDTLRVLSYVEDHTLAALYDEAAFCVYPSLYEGYGLPIVEAFSRGKAVLASNGGSIPELVGSFSPCLDPTDEEAWYSHLKRWMIDPDARLGYEEMIRTKFRHPTWDEAAEQFFRAAVDSEDATPSPCGER
jgi:glycosyltransferase involved in cell wall biosynthesis